MKSLLYFFLIILFLSSASATCSSNQADINTASLSELDNLEGIGPVKAQAIVDTRPFSSVDELDKVSGIGPVTLEKIKAQGLACVSNEEKSPSVSEKMTTKKTSLDDYEEQDNLEESFQEKITLSNNQNESVINLGKNEVTGKVIYESKNEKVRKNLLVAFCIFLIGLIFLLIRK
jgi:competence ComEA-like helix-hairpin-helix protein